jgi:hypothetical protein
MAKRASEKHGITLDEARENISARVTSKSTVPTHGTGH